MTSVVEWFHEFLKTAYSYKEIVKEIEEYHELWLVSIISSIPSLSLNSLLGTLYFTLTLHIHLTILISAR